MMKQEPAWVEEAKKEIKRLNRKIDAMHRAIKREEVDDIDALEDISNWSGWRDGISWCLKMREGKAKFPCVHNPAQKPHWLVVGGKYESG